MATLTGEQIHSLWIDRQASTLKTRTAAKELQRVYDGEKEVVLPEIEANERPSVVNPILWAMS